VELRKRTGRKDLSGAGMVYSKVKIAAVDEVELVCCTAAFEVEMRRDNLVKSILC